MQERGEDVGEERGGYGRGEGVPRCASSRKEPFAINVCSYERFCARKHQLHFVFGC